MKISDSIYQIDIRPLGYERQVAVYLVVGEKYSMLVDTGPRCSVRVLYDELTRLIDRKTLRYIALTHIHLDHGGGASTLLKMMGHSARILVHPRGVKHVVDPSKLWQASINVLGREVAELQGKPEPVDGEHVMGLMDGETIDLGGVYVKAIHTPGHAPHHIVYIVYPDKIALTGDAVAIYYDGRIHPVSPPPFKAELALESIDKIKAESPLKITVSHFGVASEPGIHVLDRAKNKIIQWMHIVREHIGKGVKDPLKIYEKLLELDEETAYIVRIRENNPLFKGSAYKSLLGIYYYLLEMKQ